jgi:DNA-binding response OmpR family regulator
LVEDEEAMRSLCRRMLEGMGLEVKACGDGQEALDAFLAEPGAFGLVITDQRMPRLNGSDLCRRIRTKDSQIPVLLYTGFMDEYTGYDIGACGADRVLMKPLPLADFQGVVGDMLQLHREPGHEAAG